MKEIFGRVFHSEKQQLTSEPHVIGVPNLYADKDMFRLRAIACIPGVLNGGNRIFRIETTTGLYMDVNLRKGENTKERIVETGRIVTSTPEVK